MVHAYHVDLPRYIFRNVSNYMQTPCMFQYKFYELVSFLFDISVYVRLRMYQAVFQFQGSLNLAEC